MKSISTWLVCLLLLTSQSPGALLYSVATDASGAFTSGGWTDTVGTATVMGPAGAGNPAGNPMLTGLTAGTLNLGNVTGFGANILTPTTATVDIALSGGTADFFASSHARDNPRNFTLCNLSGVNSFTVEFNWSTPFAAISGARTVAGNGTPFLGATRVLPNSVADAGLYDLTATYTGLQHTTDGMTMTAGLPGSAEGVDLSLSESDWNSNTSSLTWTPNRDWQAIHGFDTVGTIDGDNPTLTSFTRGVNGDSILQDEEAVYGTGIRFVYSTKDGSNFGDDAQFVFSTNGTHWRDTFGLPLIVVPEPTRAVLAAIGFIALGLRRRR